MALKRGKYTEQVSTASTYARTGNVKVIPENAFATIVKETEKGRSDLLKLQATKHEANWIADFTQSSQKFFFDLGNKYTDNPNQFEKEANAYIKTKVSKTPLVYRANANKSLEAYKAEGIQKNYAAWKTKEDNKKITNFNNSTSEMVTMNDMHYEFISDGEGTIEEKSMRLINKFIRIDQDRINTHWGSGQESLVESDVGVSMTTFNKNYETFLTDNTANFLYHMAVAQIGSSNSYQAAFNVVDAIKKGKVDELFQSLELKGDLPPTLKKTLTLLNNPEEAAKISKTVEDRLEAHMGESRASWAKDKKEDLKIEIKADKEGTQIGTLSHWSSIVADKSNLDAYELVTQKYGNGIDGGDAIAIATTIRKKQKLLTDYVLPYIKQTITSEAFAAIPNNEDKKEVIEGVMAAMGINSDSPRLFVGGEGNKILRLIGDLGVMPDSLKNYFNMDTGSFAKDGNVDSFRKKYTDFMYLKSFNERFKFDGDMFKLFEQAEAEGWMNKGDEYLSLKLQNYFQIKTEGKETDQTKLDVKEGHINVEWRNNSSDIDKYISSELEAMSDERFWAKKWMFNLIDLAEWGEGDGKQMGSIHTWSEYVNNKGAGNMFQSNWTWFPSNWTAMDLAPGVLDNIKQLTKAKLLETLPEGASLLDENGKPSLYLKNALNWAFTMNAKNGFGYTTMGDNSKNIGKIQSRNTKFERLEKREERLLEQLKFHPNGLLVDNYFVTGKDMKLQLGKIESDKKKLKKEIEWYKSNRNTDYSQYPAENWLGKPLLIKNEGGIAIETWFNNLSANDKKAVVGQTLDMEMHTWNDTFAAIRYGENMVVKHIPGQFEADGITPKYELGFYNLNGDYIQVTGDGESFTTSHASNIQIKGADVPATMENVSTKIALDHYEKFNDWTKKTLNLDMDEADKKWLRGVFLGWEDFRVTATGWEFGITTPWKEVNNTKIPYAVKIGHLFNMLGYDVNIDEHMAEISKMEAEHNGNKTLIEKSNEVDSMKLNTSIEAMAPPNEMILQDYKDGMQFEYYAKKNLNNSEIPYTLRSNNPLGVHIMGGDKKWEGELDEQATAKDGGSVLATFKHPAWGVRAAVTLMINKSELTKGINDVTKLYGHTPTVIEIITGHTAKKSIEGYLQSLEKNFGIDRNMNINLLDGDQVIPLLHAMTQHEMGIENYNKYWKGNEAMLFYYLKKGYDLSIKKYNTSK